MNCSEISGDKVCSVSCVAGYAFAPENRPLKEYRCEQSTGYTWNGLTPACGKAMIPNKLSSITAIEYNSLIPCIDSSLAIETLHKNLESTLSCYKHGICELTTSMDECENKKEAGSLKITLNATLPAEDLDLLHYLTTGMLKKGLKLLVNTLVDLENSTKKINDSYEILSFDMGGVMYSPLRKQATAIVVCGVGQGSDGPICIDCPMGTYSKAGKCPQCPKGTYQSEIGQKQCIICPTGLSTKFVGSQDGFKCTEVTNATTNSFKQDQASSTLGVTEAVIIALSVTAIVTVFLIVLSVIFRRHCGKRENE
ncbi:thyroglobulin-like [Saccostrea cucullata]|uniref:thyroglobulin-like n=1 Tax=Saccostrea cuccullata TaxID=36930 RepID=UPI002ED53546